MLESDPNACACCRTAAPAFARQIVTPVHEAPTQPMALSLFEKREELRRVLESRQFAGAPKKARFLEFVSEQTFLGNGEKLNEYLIGVEVYDRGTEFNPQKDPIVRVQAHEIRRSLRKYYEETSSGSVVRIDLPAGHYVLLFTRNDSVAPEPPAPELPAVVPAPAVAAPAPSWYSRWHLALTVAL